MSDSEYYPAKRSASSKGAKKQLLEELSDSDVDGTTSSGVKTAATHCVFKSHGTKKIKKNYTAEQQSDEEIAPKKSKQGSKPALKRKAPKKKEKSAGWFDSEDQEEEVFQQRSLKKQALQSVLTRRVADGVLRRTAALAGDVFVELKVYNTVDILNVDPKDRWEHAVLAVKYQTSSDADELVPLKDLKGIVKGIKPSFKEEGKFFSSKKK